MRVLLLAGIMMAAISIDVAQAGPPAEVVTDGVIALGVGQTKTFRFDAAIERAGTATQGIAEVAAQSNQQLTVTGIAAGETVLDVFGANGTRLYSATVTVTPENGHIVRIYGGNTKAQENHSKDFVGIWCTETSCGRADKDVSGRAPADTSVRYGPGGTAIVPSRLQ